MVSCRRRLVRRGPRAERVRAIDRHRSGRRRHDRSGGERPRACATSASSNDQTAPKSRVTLTGEYLETQLSGQSAVPGPEPDSGRQLHQQRSVRHLGRQPAHPRLRRLAHLGHVRRRAAERLRQLRAVHQPDARCRARRPRRREPGHDRRRQPHGVGDRRHGGLRTKRPTEEFGGEVVVSGGEFNYKRAFVRLDSGEFGPWGTKAFIAGSYQNYDKFKGPGELEKKQFNAVIRQDFENENFISHRRSTTTRIATPSTAPPARPTSRCSAATTTTSTRVRATSRPAASSTTRTRRHGADARPTSCRPPTTLPIPRAAPTSSACASTRRTPATFACSRCGTSARNCILTFDPSYQYTLANGGGTTTIAETANPTSSDVRVRGNSTAPGVDLNGDGDLLDTVRFYTPNTTNTNRYGATASLIWDLTRHQRMRFAYTYDLAQHRQTGQWGPMDFANGEPEDVFAGREGDRIYAADGDIIRGRDRYSDRRAATSTRSSIAGSSSKTSSSPPLGVRAPFFKRELNQYCYTPNGGNGSSGTIGAGGRRVVHLARADSPRCRTATSRSFQPANAMTPRRAVHPAVQRRRGVRRHPAERRACRSGRGTSTCSTCRTPKACRRRAPTTCMPWSRRRANGSIARPTPESETTKSYRSRLAPQSSDQHRLARALPDRLHQSHRVDVQRRSRLQRRPQRRRRGDPGLRCADRTSLRRAA